MIKWTNACVMKKEAQEREKEAQKIFKTTIAERFPN